MKYIILAFIACACLGLSQCKPQYISCNRCSSPVIVVSFQDSSSGLAIMVDKITAIANDRDTAFVEIESSQPLNSADSSKTCFIYGKKGKYVLEIHDETYGNFKVENIFVDTALGYSECGYLKKVNLELLLTSPNQGNSSYTIAIQTAEDGC